MNFTEDELEQAYLEILESLGWECVDARTMERGDYHEVILEENLREAVYSLNKNMPTIAKEEAIKKLYTFQIRHFPSVMRIFTRCSLREWI